MTNSTRILAIGSIIASGTLACLVAKPSFGITMNAADLWGSKVGMASEYRNIGLFAECLKISAPIFVTFLIHLNKKLLAFLYGATTFVAIIFSMFASFTVTDGIISKSQNQSLVIQELNQEIATTQRSYENNVKEGQRGNARLDRKRLDTLKLERSDELAKADDGQSNSMVENALTIKLVVSAFIELGSQVTMATLAVSIKALVLSFDKSLEKPPRKTTETDGTELVSKVNSDVDVGDKEQLIRTKILAGMDVNYGNMTKEFNIGRTRLRGLIQDMEERGELVRSGKRKLVLSSSIKQDSNLRLVKS